MRTIFRFGIWIISILAIIGCGGGSSGSSTAVASETHASASTVSISDPSNAPILSESTINDYMKAINEARAKEGGQDCGEYGHFDPAPPLAWSDELYHAAYEHSYDMATSDTFTHDGSGTDSDWTAQVQNLGRGSLLQERVENNNYTHWLKIGENIAAGTNFRTAEQTVQAWLSSPKHCENLMNPEFKEVGMSVVYDESSYYHYYWTQDFGSR
jgi:uncharacterized protein YkwD